MYKFILLKTLHEHESNQKRMKLNSMNLKIVRVENGYDQLLMILVNMVKDTKEKMLVEKRLTGKAKMTTK